MTSNGNTAQKTLIKNFIDWSNNITNELVFEQTIKELKTAEQKQIIRNIAKKFNIEV